MKEWRLFLVLIILIYSNFFCLANNTDSLNIQRHFDLAYQSYARDLELTYQHLDSVILLSERICWTDKQVEALLFKANCATLHARVRQTHENLVLATNLLEDYERPPEDFLFSTKQLWGYYYRALSDYDQALDNFNFIINTLENKDDLKSSEFNWLNSTYQFKADIYKRSGRYDEALENFVRSKDVEILRAKKLEEKPRHHSNDAQIAGIYRLKGDLPKAKSFYQNSLNACEEIHRKAKNKSYIKNLIISVTRSFASLYRESQEPDSALFLLHKSLTYHLTNDPKHIGTFYELGETYGDLGDFALAIDYLNESIKYADQLYGNTKRLHLAKAYAAIGNIYNKQETLDKALENYQIALIQLANGFDEMAFSSNPDLEDHIISKRLLLSTLNKKSQVLQKQFEGSQKSENLKLAWETSQIATDLIDIIRQDYTSDYDKQFLIEESYPIYEQAIRLAYQLGPDYLEKAFEFSEKSKAVLLFEAVKNTQAEKYAGVNQKDIEAINQFKVELTHCDQMIFKLEEEEELQDWRSRRLKIKQEYADLIDSLEKHNAKYYDLKYKYSVVSTRQIQEALLLPDQAMISFFTGDDHIYAFLIERNKAIQCKKLPWNENLKAYAQTIKDDIFEKNNEAYTLKANVLYSELFEPVLTASPAQSIVFIPDGVLNYIPFDALLTQAVSPGDINFRDYPFLVLDKNISQCFSASMLYEMVLSEQQSSSKSLIYAPAFRNLNQSKEPNYIASRSDLDTLIYNQQEGEEIQALIDGNLRANKLATKEKFLEESSSFGLLHIAAHAKVDDQSPNFSYVAFSNVTDTIEEHYKLYVQELYNYKLPAEMVVLSACETGVGKVLRGEGVISIARAFSYAGAKSIIMTLWNINDKCTKELAVNFYNKLKGNMRKDRALSEVKKDFIQNAIDSEYAHPKYWASFASIGDMGAIKIPNSSKKYYYFLIPILGLAALVGLIVIRKRPNKKAEI